jgi:hypothetical protein
MYLTTRDGFVGLITIDPLRAEGIPRARHEAEATLGQMLLYLAGGSDPSGTTTEPSPASTFHRAEPRASRLPFRPSRVSADCEGLAAQLDGALIETRRRIAAAV